MRKPFLILLSCCVVGVGIFIIQNRSARNSFFYWDGQNYKEKKGVIDQIKEVEPHQGIDFDGDGIDEKIELRSGTVFVYKGGGVWWQSDPAWQVENVVLADLNRDGKTELNMSLWKKGSFGNDLPFWVEKNDTHLGNHFFIYGFKNGEIRPIWGSSTIDYPIREMAVSDINSDGKNELIVLEGIYDQSRNAKAKYVGIWTWNGWGFSNDFRSNGGEFYNLRIGKDKNNQNYILVNKLVRKSSF